MKFRFNRAILGIVVSIANMNQRALCMESARTDQVQKAAVIEWIRERIQPLNAGRFKGTSIGAQSNCTLIAEKCAKVLAGLEQPTLVPAQKEDIDITYRTDENGTIIYHEVNRQEQVELVPYQEFTETVDLLDDETLGITNVDLTKTPQRDSVKYIMTTRERIIEDIQSLPGSAESLGEDKTVAGLIYYYYKDVNAGHLANFFRDNAGTIFFVDAQSEEVTQTVPDKILDYELKEEIFFYPLVPQSGYYVKKELVNSVVKSETSISYQYSASLLKYMYRCGTAMSHACDYPGCDKTFSTSSNLIMHKRTHTGEKPYVCDHFGCDKSFSRSDDLAKHKRIHTGEKPYICDYPGCDKSFAQSSNLATHKTTHLKEKSHGCDYPGCDRSFARSSDLTKHKRMHTGEKPYVCDYAGCDKSFSRSGDLTKHKRTHTGQKPYLCDYTGCDKSFATASTLKTHKRTHTGEKPYTCDYAGCNKSFSQMGNLNTHKRTHKDNHEDTHENTHASSSNCKKQKLE